MAPAKKVLVIWTKENKTSIEPLHHVPANARFDGAVSPVMFSGDKRFYPAKIVLISDNVKELESRQVDEESSLLNFKLAEDSGSDNAKRKRKSTAIIGAASERTVAKALGQKPSVPKEFEETHKAAQKDKREAKKAAIVAQIEADTAVMGNVRRDIFGPNSQYGEVVSVAANRDDDDDYDGSDQPLDISMDDDAGTATIASDEAKTEESTKTEKWCDCRPCRVLQKFDNPIHSNFLKVLCELFEDGSGQSDIQYLDLLPIQPDAKKVELTAGTNIYISGSDKDQLKVDFRNRPSALVRETLFALYGREAFSTLNVTGKGKKRGTFTIPEEVNKAVCGFVNRNVDKEKRIKLTQLASLINKRAPEWRSKSTPSPKLSRKKLGVKVPSSSPLKATPLKVISRTSPFKKTPEKIHLNSPERSQEKMSSEKKCPGNKTPLEFQKETIQRSPQSPSVSKNFRGSALSAQQAGWRPDMQSQWGFDNCSPWSSYNYNYNHWNSTPESNIPQYHDMG